MLDQLTLTHKILLWTLPILFAITFHEVAHGWVAYKFGDDTAKLRGRLTLNPIKHIDPIGTIAVPAMLIFLGSPFLFGWAKPVPVNFNQLRSPRRDMALVALAGPVSNLLMAIFWAFVMKIGFGMDNKTIHDLGTNLILMGYAGFLINLILMALNIIPIPPLDGSRVVSSFLSPQASKYYSMIEPYGFFILIALMVTQVLWVVMQPIVKFSISFVSQLVGLPPIFN